VREGRKEGTVGEGRVGNEGEGGGTGRLKNPKGQWEVQKEAWGVLDLVWPKPGSQYQLRISLIYIYIETFQEYDRLI